MFLVRNKKTYGEEVVCIIFLYEESACISVVQIETIVNCLEFKEKLLGRICRLCGFTKLKREISYLENLNKSEETAYENLINFALIF